MNQEFLDRIDAIAERVNARDALFFVGAGFSIDAEQVTTQRLLGRLIARFMSLCFAVAVFDQSVHAEVHHLFRTFVNSFLTPRIKKLPDKSRDKILEAIAEDYYVLNDWLAKALEELLEKAISKLCIHQPDTDFLRFLSCADGRALRYWLGNDPSLAIVNRPLAAIDFPKLSDLPEGVRGKCVMFEAMGFGDYEIMAGLPDAANLDDVRISYKDRLLPRHFCLARLAREGLSPLIVTTNFDVLLEGAYRLTGFSDPAAIRTGQLFPQPYRRVSRAQDYYYADGGSSAALGRQIATILKIHGCVERFRSAQELQDRAAILKTLVFTYREVQNWRQDTWSRDLMMTLVRTKTMVFCGYSTVDPVLHDSIRTIYEEMAGQRQTSGPPKNCKAPTAEAAPAFYFNFSTGAPKTPYPFHANEVLRAASAAVGAKRPSITGHPNLIDFRPKSTPKTTSGLALGLDDLFRLIFHRSYRLRQQRAISDHLAATVGLVLGKPPQVEAVEFVKKIFDVLVKAEWEALTQINASRAHATTPLETFEAIVGWTWRFHPALLNAQALNHHSAAEGKLAKAPATGPNWYSPMAENLTWATWNIVVEIALRRLFLPGGQKELWQPLLRVSEASHPGVEFAPRGMSPLHLDICIGGLPNRRRYQPIPRMSQVLWRVEEDRLPWGSRDKATPSAQDLWNLASQPSIDQILKAAPPPPWVDALHLNLPTGKPA